MSYGDESDPPLETMHGREFPTIRQLTVFLENRVGQLKSLVSLFEGSDVRIVSLSITEAVECAFVRLVLSHPELGRQILEHAGMPLVESELIGLELPASPQPLLSVFTALIRAEVNVTQVYPLLARPHGRASVALLVDNMDMAKEVLATNGFTMLDETDLESGVN